GTGNAGFIPRSILESGLYIPGNGKGLVQLGGAGGHTLVAPGANGAPVKLFALRKAGHSLSLQPGDVSALIRYHNGTTRKEEVYYGASFLSQSGRFIDWNDRILSVERINKKGQHRIIRPPL